IYPMYLCNWLHREGLATKDCLNFRCDVLDSVIVVEVLNALQPAELELALAALQELESRDQAIMRQWQMRLERAEYEAALAKRMLRLLIKDITVEKLGAEHKQLLVHIRWQGGACTNRSVQLPLNIADRLRYPATVVQRVRELAQALLDVQIADQLNREGHSSA